MNKLIKLTKTLLKNTNIMDFQGNTKLSKILIGVLLLSFLPVIYSLYELSNYLYKNMEPIGQEGVIISYAFVGLALMIFFFGIFYVLALFYYSKDIELLLYMPFSPYQIIGSKLLLVIIYEYIVVGMLYTPLAISFGIQDSAGVVYYLYAIVLFLLLPVIPLIIGGIFVMIIMRFTNLGKRKELMTFVGSILVLVVALGFNFLLQKQIAQSGSEAEFFALVMEGDNSLVDVIAKMFPGMGFAAKSLIHWDELSGFTNFIAYLGTCALFVAVFFTTGEKIYFQGAIGITESGAKREKIQEREWNKASTKRTIVVSLVIKEFRLLLRSPIYFMNCILISLLLPLIFVFVIGFSGGDQEMEALIELFKNSSGMETQLALFFGVAITFGSLNGITATGISREGKSAYVMKYIPIPLMTQVNSKVIVSMIVGFVGTILFGGALIYSGVDLVTSIIGIVIGTNGLLFSALTGIIIDLIRPKLQWDSEQQAVKQNINSLLNMVFSFAVAFGIGFIVIKLQLQLFTILILLIGGFGALNILLYRAVKSVGVKQFIARDL